MIRTMASTVAIATGSAQRDYQARTSALLLPINYLSPIVEVELGQGPCDHVLGHLLRHREVAAAHGDVVEADDPGQLLAADDGEPPHAVLDHQRRRLVELFFFQAEDGIRDGRVTGVQTCALPISPSARLRARGRGRRPGATARRAPRASRRR